MYALVCTHRAKQNVSLQQSSNGAIVSSDAQSIVASAAALTLSSSNDKEQVANAALDSLGSVSTQGLSQPVLTAVNLTNSQQVSWRETFFSKLFSAAFRSTQFLYSVTLYCHLFPFCWPHLSSSPV